VKLVFALEADTALSNGLQTTDNTLAGPHTAKKWDKQALLRKKGAAKEAHASENKETVSTEEGIAKAAADKAIEIANALTQKFPAKNKTAHQGQYDTLDRSNQCGPEGRIRTWTATTTVTT
jgi:hypothetical protein